MSVKIVIPARKGSKGFPDKNKKLFQYTVDIIPKHVVESVYVTSNDGDILTMAKDKRFNIFRREEKLSDDKASVKDVLLNLTNTKWDEFNADDIIVMLYLTFPQRKWQDIENALQFFMEHDASSLLCKIAWKGAHPALAMVDDGLNGRLLFQHDMYRRQQYPKVFQLYHYIFICKVKELHKLNNNLYNGNTIYFPVDDNIIDVDTPEEFEMFQNSTQNNESTTVFPIKEIARLNERIKELEDDRESLKEWADNAVAEAKQQVEEMEQKIEQMNGQEAEQVKEEESNNNESPATEGQSEGQEDVKDE